MYLCADILCFYLSLINLCMAKGKKTGGRQVGSKNKVPHVKKEYIAGLLGEYFDSDLMQKDFLSLDPKDRLATAEKLMKFVLPTMQSTAVDMNIEGGGQSLEERLNALSSDEEEADGNI